MGWKWIRSTYIGKDTKLVNLSISAGINNEDNNSNSDEESESLSSIKRKRKLARRQSGDKNPSNKRTRREDRRNFLIGEILKLINA